MRPRKPEHADKISTPPGVESRVQIRRRLVQYSYPQNGNVHNATPEYFWDILVDGRCVDTFRLRREAVAWARDHSAKWLLEMTVV
ncbi:hypothetical protein [Pimelobacter simplex]|uniref:hypothetical protein n=1 Tax=Nocardioides simplex TaxID=2045 RepID=UPI00214F92F0|nr:hypothetical protein [Pimelobacter simplex]UUW87413.1 hypothetical protein M0M43_16860 [Pimelobacter simplex]UUW96918.1 hypothetical protein M0M48_05505 [Pimelobacter simplex]